jgi:hypothetical protein
MLDSRRIPLELPSKRNRMSDGPVLDPETSAHMEKSKMKIAFATLAACALLTTGALAADPAGPADKKDAGSLSSGAKESMPATKHKGENAPVGATGDANSGTSAGESGSAKVPGTQKGMGSSDPAGATKK